MRAVEPGTKIFQNRRFFCQDFLFPPNYGMNRATPVHGTAWRSFPKEIISEDSHEAFLLLADGSGFRRCRIHGHGPRKGRAPHEERHQDRQLLRERKVYSGRNKCRLRQERRKSGQGLQRLQVARSDDFSGCRGQANSFPGVFFSNAWLWWRDTGSIFFPRVSFGVGL